MSASASDASPSVSAGSSQEEEWKHTTSKTKKKQHTNNHTNNITNNNDTNDNTNTTNNDDDNCSGRRKRLPRACTARSSSRLFPPAPTVDRKQRPTKREVQEKVDQEEPQPPQCSKIITPLLNSPPSPSQLPRWNLRAMWELAAILNFLHVFRPLLNITVEFSAEELETALITPNSTLDDIHMPILKAIPPVTRMALGRATWVTVLCRKLRDWWHWVADGEIPIVASHGTEVEVYKDLDPGIRVVILKALCDIRVEQEDTRNFIDDNLKHGVQLSLFRKERIGGDSQGISYWYEDDPIIGHRLYREIRKVEVKVEAKKAKAKGSLTVATISCQWETVAANLDEFIEVSEKLFSSKNRTESAVGKKLKFDMLPEIEKIHKRKEKMLKKQHRQALLLDSYLSADGLATGRSLRDRKPVTYTFDDFDRSINEAIKITKRRQSSPESVVRREASGKPETSTNGRLNGSHAPRHVSCELPSPKSTDNEETDGEHKPGPLDRNDRKRQRPQRYSVKEFVEAVSDNEADFDSDDDIVGEAVYDEEYLRNRKHRKVSSSSEADEEYHWDDENAEDEEEEDDSLSSSEDADEPHRSKKLRIRTRRGTKLRSVDELQSGLRRSKRATRNRIDYRQLEISDSEADSVKAEKFIASDGCSDASDNVQCSTGSQDFQGKEDVREMNVDQPIQEYHDPIVKEEGNPPEKTTSLGQEGKVVQKRQFLDLNELAPGTGFDDPPSTIMGDEDTDNF